MIFSTCSSGSLDTIQRPAALSTTALVTGDGTFDPAFGAALAIVHDRHDQIREVARALLRTRRIEEREFLQLVRG